MSQVDIKSAAQMIASAPYGRRRRLVAITGAPGSGKSTIAKKLQAVVPNSAVVPMDGFHLDNAVLDARGLRARKGAPQTFDVEGLEKLVLALGEKDNVSYPLFDREQDRAIPDAGQIGPEVETVLIEGNYLMLNRDGWGMFAALWDYTIMLNVPLDELERRLLKRWRDLGLPEEEVKAKTYGNDLPNAKTVIDESYVADWVI